MDDFRVTRSFKIRPLVWSKFKKYCVLNNLEISRELESLIDFKLLNYKLPKEKLIKHSSFLSLIDTSGMGGVSFEQSEGETPPAPPRN